MPPLFSLSSLNEVVNDVDWQWEDDGRILLDANLRQCLQVSKLKGHRLGGNRRRRIRQHVGAESRFSCFYAVPFNSWNGRRKTVLASVKESSS
jgi:hypothetical protein